MQVQQHENRQLIGQRAGIDRNPEARSAGAER
jgi:hypothetical protein